jgi:hypothetical protein
MSPPADKKRKAGTVHVKGGGTSCRFKRKDDNGAPGGAAAAAAKAAAISSKIQGSGRTPPPHPRRYWALWARGYFDGDGNNEGEELSNDDDDENGGAVADDVKGGSDGGRDGTAVASRGGAAAAGGCWEEGGSKGAAIAPRRHCRNRRRRLLLRLRRWEEEMELARSCQRIRDRIRLCRRPAEPDDDDDDERTGAPTTNHQHGLVGEVGTLERELEKRTALTGRFANLELGTPPAIEAAAAALFQKQVRPRVVSGDRDFARALLNSSDIMPLSIDGPHLPSTEGSGC